MGAFHRFLDTRPQDIVSVRKRLKWAYFSVGSTFVVMVLAAVMEFSVFRPGSSGLGLAGVFMGLFAFYNSQLLDLRRTYWSLLDQQAVTESEEADSAD